MSTTPTIILRVTSGYDAAVDCALSFVRNWPDRKPGMRHGVIFSRRGVPAVMVYWTKARAVVVLEDAKP